MIFVVCVLQFVRPELYQKSNRSSHSSDTSSAYSGSDTMTSVHSSVEADDVDLSGLVESVVDSDEEDLAESTDVSIYLYTRKLYKYSISLQFFGGIHFFQLVLFRNL